MSNHVIDVDHQNCHSVYIKYKHIIGQFATLIWTLNEALAYFHE